jgi:hypothetical protein
VGALVATSAVVRALVFGVGNGTESGTENGTENGTEHDTETGSQSGRDSAGSTTFEHIETPCFTFDAPADYLNDESADDTAACLSHLKLWGERDANGRILKTGFGSVLGSVQVSSALVTFSQDLAPDGTLDSAVDALNVEHLATLGTVTSLKQRVTLDGTPANNARVASHVATTKTKIMIASYAAQMYETEGGAVHLLLIYLVNPEDNGEEILAFVLNSWRWKDL